MVRIAGQKYIESKVTSSYAEALDRLLKEYIFPKSLMYPWQEFRDNQLWLLDTNLVLDQNMEPLK